jgi:hypothetical protein
VDDDYSCLLFAVFRIKSCKRYFWLVPLIPSFKRLPPAIPRNRPWSQSQVCGLWRAAALGTLILWANISVAYDENLKLSGDHSCQDQVRNLADEGVRRACHVYGPNLQVTSSDGEDVIITVARDVLRHSDKIVRQELDMECQRLILPLLSVPTGGRLVGPWSPGISLSRRHFQLMFTWTGKARRRTGDTLYQSRSNHHITLGSAQGVPSNHLKRPR